MRDPKIERLVRLSTYASVSTAGTLIAIKLFGYIQTDAVSLLSSLVDSLLDAAASVATLYAVRRAQAPADREHRFGHGKAEPLAALGQAAFIAGSAIFLILEAGNRLYNPPALANTSVGIAVMVFSIIATLGLIAFQGYVVRKSGSVAIRADRLHYVGDVLTNLSVILALVLVSQLGWLLVDPIFAIGIAGFILHKATQIARAALDMLMDRELADADRKRIIEIVGGHPEVLAMHDLRTRTSGPDTFIQMHLELDGSMSLHAAHAIADAVEAEVRAAFPGAEVIIHEDPYGVEQIDDQEVAD
jgi:ferrous-iron efflux pump FieF